MPKSAPHKVKVRPATSADVPEMVALNRAAYPALAEDNVVWGEKHLLRHLEIFPQGQFVATLGKKIVGAASSLIVSLGKDPLRHHTWSGITDSGFFTNHDPDGDSLYGADVCTHPDARGQGVGHALYDARRQLCCQLNLRRIVAGGRLWGYCDHAERMSAEEYAYQVANGTIRDLVLSFQIREGFQLRGVMPHYLTDKRSHNFASLIEWINPGYKPKKSSSDRVRVACVQYQMRKVKSFAEFAAQVTYFVDVAADYGSDFILLPELFSVQLLSQTQSVSPQEGMRQLSDYTPKLVRLLKKLAVNYGVTLIGGSHPVKKGKRLLNIAHVCLPDGTVVEQPKLHITPNERKWWGISGGDTLGVIDTPKGKIGVLICYDIEFPEATRYLVDQGAEIIFVPFCTDSRHGYLRVRYCAQARAIENQIYVAMAGNVGNLPDVQNMDIQYGQACVLTPSDFPFARDGIRAEADSNEETVLICDLHLNDLRNNRTDGTVTPHLDRRIDLFRFVTPFHGSAPNVFGPEDKLLGDQPVDPGNSAESV